VCAARTLPTSRAVASRLAGTNRSLELGDAWPWQGSLTTCWRRLGGDSGVAVHAICPACPMHGRGRWRRAIMCGLDARLPPCRSRSTCRSQRPAPLRGRQVNHQGHPGRMQRPAALPTRSALPCRVADEFVAPRQPRALSRLFSRNLASASGELDADRAGSGGRPCGRCARVAATHGAFRDERGD